MDVIFLQQIKAYSKHVSYRNYRRKMILGMVDLEQDMKCFEHKGSVKSLYDL